ncbi:unnamed protein product [Mytilus coruscus]|uniref:Integrase catalytic domain-containing protein n=1 Tax=Mytilus coruscus TaxID=42192 RepID=A0A6J8EQ42_MYTCO|nr:unnamed protein product [Mytilus coruscus]
MKSALNRIFVSKSQNAPGERDSVVTIKEESAFVSNGYYQRGRSSRRNFPRINRAVRSTNFSRLKTKMNPVLNENVSRCKIYDCPHKQLNLNLTEHEINQSNETVNITLFTSAQEFKPLTSIFRDIAENLNMSVKTTAGYSPWSNGVVERHNAALTETINKMRESSNLSWETAASWAVHAKNSLLNVYGNSPYQIVFGRNPNMPASIVNKPPALEVTTISNTMGKHLFGLHEAYTKLEKLLLQQNPLRKLEGHYISKSGLKEKNSKMYTIESDEEEPHHNDTDNDESQENSEGSAEESVADSSDRVDSHAGSQNCSLNGEDNPGSDDRDSLDLENQIENDIHEGNMEHNA